MVQDFWVFFSQRESWGLNPDFLGVYNYGGYGPPKTPIN